MASAPIPDIPLWIAFLLGGTPLVWDLLKKLAGAQFRIGPARRYLYRSLH